ncbi:MAG: response regulator [bacterium]
MPYNILLVDDDQSFRKELSESLEEYNVIGAANGEEALRILKAPHEIDLVLLDVMMPGRPGTEILKEIKKIGSDLKIIILTAFSSKDVAIRALRGRADDYLEKPLKIDETKRLIAKVLDKKNNLDATDTMGKVERVKYFIERNYHKIIGLKDVAKLVNLTPKYLSRVFKEYTGVGFNDYKLMIKTAKAKEWLNKTGYNVGQIADKLGYENPESFIRVFKKLTGFTPKEYSKSKRRRIKIKPKGVVAGEASF